MGTNRAAVVVEVDGVIHTAKVTFSASSISGLDALRSAGFNPLVRVFGGNGGAVCALDIGGTTIGCPADSTCLTCDAPRYWAYYRAPAGATQYTYSPAGAGLTQVHDGDVEAWAWGTGSAPSPFVSFDDVWGPDPPPPTTRPPATAPPTTHPTSPASPTTLGAPGTVTTAPAGSVLGTSASPTTTAGTRKGGASTTTSHGKGAVSKNSPTSERSGATTDGQNKLAAAPVVARGGGGSPFGLIAFGAVLAVLVVAIVLARRRRSISAAGDHATG